MGQPQPQFITHAEYLAAEERAPQRSEYVAGAIYAMVGTSLRHNAIAFNFASLLRAHLNGRCQVFMSDVKVQVQSADAYYYPDVVVRCGGGAAGGEQFLTNPKLIVEVLSPGTEAFDRKTKLRSYQSLPSLIEYVLVSQEERLVELYRRQGDLGWFFQRFNGDQLFSLESVELTAPVAALYSGTDV